MANERPSSERVLTWIPAIAALALAALYSVGALLTAAGLRGAGLSIRDTLPLFSLEKLLARGISTLIGSILLLVALVLFGMLLAAARTRVRRSDSSRRAVITATATAVVVLLAALAFSSPVLGAALLVSLAIGVTAQRAFPGVPRLWVWGAQYLVVLVGLIASAYAYPQPLPAAEVQVAEGPPVAGDLVTTTDFAWYVAGVETDAVRAIPAADIENAEFVSREREDPPAFKDLVADVFD